MIHNQLARLVKLFDDNIEWAKLLAARVHRRVPPCFELADLEQEATIEMWKRCQMYDPHNKKGAPFRAYAYLAVRGACLMSVRRKAWREKAHESLQDLCTDDEGNLLQDETPDPRPAPEQQIIEKQVEAKATRRLGRQRDWLEEETAKLSPGDKYLLEQHHVEGVPLDELARVVAIPRKVLGRRLAGVVKRLKEESVA